MAQMDSQPAADLAMQPSPVLLEAVLKVEQVVARLQDLQTTIAGLHLSPVNPKHIRSSRANATTRTFYSKDSASSRDEATVSTRRRDEFRRSSWKGNKADVKMQPAQSLKPKEEWKQWSSPANQVHDVISEILMASQFAKQIATLVAEALQEGPQKTDQEPVVDQAQEPKKRACREGKKKDIAFPTKAQVQKTMSAKAPPSKPVNKFKVVFPSDGPAKLGPPAKLSRPAKDPQSSRISGPASSHKRRMSRGHYSSNSSSPKSLSPRSPRLVMQRSEKLFSSPNDASFRESDDADDELSAGPRRHMMNVTEIKGPVKPWKLTPTKGVLFSNPVYLSSPKSSVSPVKNNIVPTTGRRRSWLTHQLPKSKDRSSPEAGRRRESIRKLKSPAASSANPLLSSSLSKVTFKREGAAPKSDVVTIGSSKRELHKGRKAVVAPPSRYVEMVPLDGSQNSSVLTMLDVLRGRSPPRHELAAAAAATPARSVRTTRRLAPLNANRSNEIAEELQCRGVSHSQTKSSPCNVESQVAIEHEKSLAHPKHIASGSVDFSDKENAPVPSCAPAVMFLRSLSNAHTLNRTLSRKNSGVSLLQRAKGWMSSQAIKQGRVIHELER